MEHGEERKDARFAANKAVQIERLISGGQIDEETGSVLLTNRIRPSSFDDFPGQNFAKENLRIYIEAAKQRKQVLDHVILHGPPGLGKTTLAQIIAKEMGVNFCQSSGPSIDRPGDLAGILSGLEPNSLLFIDEIHRLPIQVEEVLYSAMEDYTIDLIIGQGATARTVNLSIPPFTLVGATTKLSLLSKPFLSRFGIQEKLDFYEHSALSQIVMRSAHRLNIKIDEIACHEIALRSRGTPRVANRLLRRAWDFAQIDTSIDYINSSLVSKALTRLEIDKSGLDRTDRAILEVMADRYDGGPVGVEALATALGEDRATLEEVYEPYLVYEGFIARSPRGRILTAKGREHLQLR